VSRYEVDLVVLPFTFIHEVLSLNQLRHWLKSFIVFLTSSRQVLDSTAIRPWLVPCKLIPVYHSPIILPLGAIWCRYCQCVLRIPSSFRALWLFSPWQPSWQPLLRWQRRVEVL
jgi:hypothetical protein